jgi:hypothetical protein
MMLIVDPVAATDSSDLFHLVSPMEFRADFKKGGARPKAHVHEGQLWLDLGRFAGNGPPSVSQRPTEDEPTRPI